MESWRIVWRDGFLPSIPTEGLLALKKGLEDDDPRLLQGATTQPPPLMCVAAWPVEAADPIGFAYFVGVRQGSATVGETESFFAATCFEADQRLGEPAACRHALNFIDDAPRDEMRASLLEEVCIALVEREKAQINSN